MGGGGVGGKEEGEKEKGLRKGMGICHECLHRARVYLTTVFSALYFSLCHACQLSAPRFHLHCNV